MIEPSSLSFSARASILRSSTWQSPRQGKVEVRGRVADADDKCDNGIEWTLYHGQRALATGKLDKWQRERHRPVELEVALNDLAAIGVCLTMSSPISPPANAGPCHFLACAGTSPAALSATKLSETSIWIEGHCFRLTQFSVSLWSLQPGFFSRFNSRDRLVCA
jgi:hypothetical protein